MIITRLQGGLGNQMFQYAFARYLSITNKCQLKLDTSFFSHPQNKLKRKFRLNAFNIKQFYASSVEVEKIKLNKKNLFEKITKKQNIVVQQKYEKYNPNNLNLKGNIYLNGYFQSEKYFKPISNIIRKEFTLKNKPPENKISEKITRDNSVAVHIRRTDYETNHHSNQFHGLCTMEYYQKAINYITAKQLNPCFYIFTDDVNWAKAKFNKSKNTIVIYPDVEKPENDLYLMSQCKHQIIGNSSYSWWGAWLNSNPDKIIIAPNKWYNQAPEDATSPVCENWIIL